VAPSWSTTPSSVNPPPPRVRQDPNRGIAATNEPAGSLPLLGVHPVVWAARAFSLSCAATPPEPRACPSSNLTASRTMSGAPGRPRARGSHSSCHLKAAIVRYISVGELHFTSQVELYRARFFRSYVLWPLAPPLPPIRPPALLPAVAPRRMRAHACSRFATLPVKPWRPSLSLLWGASFYFSSRRASSTTLTPRLWPSRSSHVCALTQTHPWHPCRDPDAPLASLVLVLGTTCTLT